MRVCASPDCDPGECVELTEREFALCRIICSSDAPVSFTQLKQSTNLHQELVSRIVKRLQVHGLVSKVEGRYSGRCSR
ncbi:MAG: MarR family transcriptional regulator [Nitrososphaerota archaeon]|jgi:DNA-binding IscR family transcriptional regulator|nr:MarR family transcriptional regulator [Nitrososphaerota archaeon]MDG6967361.1 MarR family transcriptional regulator [Nitrososphaerota archaeon]MDG6978439.1 MarR family transcriptional regulator [Nitrososphaerota archaeon]MDG7021208.1 MarR family transcriptional regulator [Nitrososphaerota archaeon]